MYMAGRYQRLFVDGYTRDNLSLRMELIKDLPQETMRTPIQHGFDYCEPGVCRCGDPENLHVLRPLTRWIRLRLLFYDVTGKLCPHVEQIPTAGLVHAAHDHSTDELPQIGILYEAILFCLDCWVATPTNDNRAVATMRDIQQASPQ